MIKGKKPFSKASSLLRFGAAISSLGLSVAAIGGQAAAAADEELSEVVITGTLIRGAPPTGSNVISVTSADVAATGVTTTSQLLATIPQVANMFNALPQIPTTSAGGTTPNGGNIQVLRPNLRNTPSSASSTGSATLILIDGHRIVNVGVQQSAPDPEAVPPGAIERVEIITDGGSSTYGSDAIGGVINFITRRSFDGVKIDARQGWADNYKTFDTNLTAGTKLGNGGVYFSYNYAKHDSLFGRDRSYVKTIDWNTGIPGNRSCDRANVILPGGVSYAYPGLTANTFNSCDTAADAAFYPGEARHSLFAGLSQDFGSNVKFDLRAFYTTHSSTGISGPLRGSATVAYTPNAATPTVHPFYYVPIAANPTANQTVNFSFGPVTGNGSYLLTNKYEELGITPTITWDINGNWQLRGMLNYGDSTASYVVPAINTAKLNAYASGTTAATALNVYNLASATNIAAINDILAWENAGDGKDKISNARAIIDGALFSLPGGKLRVALGAEYLKDEYKNRYINFAVGTGAAIGAINSTPYTSYARTVKSAFGEVQIPIVGAANAMPGLRALDLNVSARYDKYSDFGNTTNPKYGLSYKPVDWITLRGNWGKSFNAPTAVDKLGALTNTLSSNNAAPLAVPLGARPFVAGVDNTILFLGADPNLEPQTAKTYSIGLDVSPPVVPGLKFSVSYYNIDYKGFLGRAPFFSNATAFFQYYPKQGVLFPTAAQIAALVPQAAIVTPSIAILLADLQSANPTQRAYEIVDFRTFNLGNTTLSGLDLSIDYTHPTSFGSIDARVSGNKQVTHYTQGSTLAPFVDDLLFTPVFQGSASLGATIGKLRAQATVNYTNGNNVQRTSALPQDHASSYTVGNLYFMYDVQGQGMWEDLSFNLNVNNVLDQIPPVYRLSTGSGYTNGQTIGRLIQVGVSKKF